MPIRFTLTQVEAFCWIARLGTFQEAAKQLNLSQPTISLRVRNLERALGARLFERLGRGVRLSTEGTALFEHAATLLDAARHIEEQVAPGESVEGMLHIGVQENFAVTCLPELVDISIETTRRCGCTWTSQPAHRWPASSRSARSTSRSS